MNGKISIEGMRFFGYHGCYAEEQRNGGWYSVDVSIEAPVLPAGETDKISDAINYESLYKITATEMDIPRKLLETLCVRISKNILMDLPQIDSVTVTVRKLSPPLLGEASASVVSFTLNRE